MSRFDLLVFDLDGVLVDSEPIANRVLLEHLNAAGVPVTLDELLRDFVGLSLPSCYALVRERYGAEIPEAFTPALQAETFRRYRAELRPVAGVRAALDALGGMARCVASSSEPEKIRLSLELAGLAGYFGGNLFSAQDVARGKPHPDLFLHAAQSMGAAPARTAVVEDSLPGVRAGIAAGMTVFAYVGAPHAPAASLAAAGAECFAGMLDLVRKILGQAAEM